MIGIIVRGGSVFADVIETALEIVLGIIDRHKVRTWECLLSLHRGILLMRRKNLGVAVYVTATASRNFEYIHVQSQFLIPSQ